MLLPYEKHRHARRARVINHAAVGGRGSRTAFGFLNRAAVGWAVCFAFGLFYFFVVLSVTISKPPRMMFHG